MASDLYDLGRFLRAQEGDGEFYGRYAQAVGEIAAGKKLTHWMWYIFPRVAPPDASSTSLFFSLEGPLAARAYLRHPVLGPRLRACVWALLSLRNLTAMQIFGEVDAEKLRECLELFALVSRRESEFRKAADMYFPPAR